MRTVITILILSAAAFATHTCVTCYISDTSCADSNAGSAKGSPWCHAPGMPSATGNASTQVPVAGDSYIFEGGSTWHFGNTGLGSSSGGTWVWSWAGSIGNPIYIGVDKTWFTGGSWVRPILTGDNPLSATFVASCSFDNYANLTAGAFFETTGTVSYVTLDNFEWPGRCWAGTSGSFGGQIYLSNTPDHFIFSNNYVHGWSTVDTTADGYVVVLGTGAENADHNQLIGNVFDGSDSSRAAAGSAHCQWAGVGSNVVGCQSGGILYQASYDLHQNIFRYSSNFAVLTNNVTTHDNLFEFGYPSYQNNGPHPNVINQDANVVGVDIYFYNNIIRHIYMGEQFFFAVPGGHSFYNYNNVTFDVGISGVTAPQNCYFLNSTHSGTSTAYFYNDTFDWGAGGCMVNGTSSNLAPFSTNWKGTVNFQNDHFVGYDASHSSPTIANAVTTCNVAATCTFTDNGNELFQTETVANGQGYISGNNYAPTLLSNSTVGAGANLSASCGSGFTSDLCSGTSGGVSEQSGSGGQVASYPAIAIIPRGTTFDIGAYQFNGAALPATCTPTSGVVPQTVTCTNPNAGTTVACYNTTGSPATNGLGTGCAVGSTAYTVPLSISVPETLYIVAGTSTLSDSSVNSYTYTSSAPIAAPAAAMFAQARPQ